MKKRFITILGVNIKRLTIIAVLLALITASFITIPVNATDDIPASSKITSSLSLRVQMKVQLISESGSMLPDEVTLPGMDIQSLENPVELAYEKVFLSFSQQPSQTQISELETLGVTVYPDSWIPPVGNHPTGFVLAKMPVGALNSLAAKDFIMQMDTAEQEFYPQNDAARTATGVNDVWSGGNTGAGVTVAVLDSGIDTSNPDFPALNTSNSKDYSSYPTLDDTITNTVTGHGTHVTGSVLGRGVNSTTYKGMSPGADLVFLKIGNDTTGGASSDAMVYAIRAAADTYHADIISLSYGGWSLYHDGSDAVCQAIDYAVSQGVTVFASAGNNANNAWHYSGTVSAGGTTDYIQINVSSSSSYLYTGLVWYDGLGTHNTLTLQYYNSAHSYLGTTNVNQSESERGTEVNLCQLPISSGTYYLKVQNFSADGQFFHIYYYGGASAFTFSNPDPNYTIGSPAEADGAIAVGAYVTRGSWTNFRGAGYSYGETVGMNGSFSARGPRVDTGAPQKPEIVAPGSAIISARDPVYQPAESEYEPFVIDNDGLNLDGAGPCDYYVMQGTSMACPVAAGIGALLLEFMPSLTPAQVKQVLENTATDKGATGFDNTYGYGLINASLLCSTGSLSISTAPVAGTSVDDLLVTQPIILVKDQSGNPKSGIKVHALVGTGTGILRGTLTAVSDGSGLATFTDLGYNKSGEVFSIRFAAGTTSIESTMLGPLSTGTPAQIRVETSSEGLGTILPPTILVSGEALTVYGIVRDQFGNYISNPSDTAWSLINKTGGVVDADLSGSSGANTTMTGHLEGSAIIHAVNDVLSGNSGVVTVKYFNLENSLIAFTSSRDGNQEIYIMNADGSNQARLTNNSATDYDPSISPDGSKIAFASMRNGSMRIFVMDIDGNNVIELTGTRSNYRPQWSPDGSIIVFYSSPDGQDDEIYVMNADGSNQIQLTNNTAIDNQPSWSPDGSKIVFCSTRGGAYDIWVMNADGSNPIQLTNSSGSWLPAWSPDGTKIAFNSAQDTDTNQIWIMDVDGGNQIRLTSTFFSLSPAWSPDGTKIAFCSDHGEGQEIYTMDANGTNQARLTNSNGYNKDPSWAYHSEYSGLLRVQTVPAVPTRIYIDGIPRDDWGLNWVKMEPGAYTLSFSDVYGFNTPTSVTVNYYPGTTGNVQSLSEPINIYANVVTEVIVNFEQLGNLWVEISPPMPATVFCNGHPMDDWGFWCNIEPGDYTISFQDMDGYVTPEPQVVTVTAGYETTHIVGTYVSGENDVEAPTVGLLRVQTNPAVPTRIFLDGLPRNDWGLNWVKMTPGDYMLSFSDVYGYGTPTSVTVNYYPGTTGNVQSLSEPIHISADVVTEVIVNFVPLGNLRVETSPAVPATIFCNGNPIDDWGFWCNIEPGEYTISFEPKEGYLTPPPIVVTVVAGAGTHVIGDYINGTSEVAP